MVSKDRTPGVDLPDDVVARILDDTVPASQLAPRVLWICKLQRTKGYTSDWSAVSRAFNTILDLLISGGGYIVKQKRFMLQFQHFLCQRRVVWSFAEADDAVTGLRCMQQSLLEIRRQPDGGRAPRAYGKLQILTDKLHIRGRSPSRSHSRSRRRSPSRCRTRNSSRSQRPRQRRRTPASRSPPRRREALRDRSDVRGPHVEDVLPLPDVRSESEYESEESSADLRHLEGTLFQKSQSMPASLPVP